VTEEFSAMEPHRHVRGVLDTSTVIMLSRITDPAALPVEPLITAVTLAELTVGPLVATTEAERAARQAHVQQAEADFEPLPFDAAAARAFGRVAASMRRAGRKPTACAYDAMIAATALARELPLYTCNPDDFGEVDDLIVVPVAVPLAV
jgi:tRNA(fMet)-specific endonuclease VapC